MIGYTDNGTSRFLEWNASLSFYMTRKVRLLILI